MYAHLRPWLFKLDPEKAHETTLKLLRVVGSTGVGRGFVKSFYRATDNPIELFGVTFKNQIGLAAGYDKDGTAWKGLSTLGFGHIEIGTVTPLAQPGNPKPRVFRLVEDEGLVNRMGFPSQGAEFVKKQLTDRNQDNIVLGVNIGKNKNTLLEDAYLDYAHLIKEFAPLADYLTINISSPNTPGLRKLQTKTYLNDLLKHLNNTRNEQDKSTPLLVKLSPDLADADLDDALDAILTNQIDGVIATNTTISREGLKSQIAGESGGLSGSPLTHLSTQMVSKIIKRTGDKLPVIAVGGVMNAIDAQEKLDGGAKLVQIFTGMIYQGPRIVQNIVSHISK